jgi:integrase
MQEGIKKMPSQKRKQALSEIISFTFPYLHTGVEWYVIFYAFDPSRNKMRRKRIKLNYIKKKSERRRYADGLLKRLIQKLEQGWNPWIEDEHEKSFHLFKDVVLQYRQFLDKMYSDNLYREDTYISYTSQLRNIERWNEERKNPITYIYQFNTSFVRDFLEHVFIERNNSARTRNNYLAFIRTFSVYLLQRQYVNVNPTEGVANISRIHIKKTRTVIEETDLVRLYNYLTERNKYFLLACYVLYYCFIRPKEMSMIQLKHISLRNQTITIPGNISKNHKSGVVTLPEKVIHLMIDLDIFNSPNSYYLFSDEFKPGKTRHSEKQFRDYWIRYVRKDLKFPATYKFYSLKDSGITSMLRKYDTITVRDQARHADILMTDTYTPHDIQKANELIKRHEGVF